MKKQKQKEKKLSYSLLVRNRVMDSKDIPKAIVSKISEIFFVDKFDLRLK